ncbi:flagellar basal body P-ring protein FlgI [Crateriforma spongiae]|uniref:flagellar basal body P-ring protein FlgI n=1 Tax=Crateriforma spongiae TaxID=2724528 RepID=UPI0039B1276C
MSTKSTADGCCKTPPVGLRMTRRNGIFAAAALMIAGTSTLGCSSMWRRDDDDSADAKLEKLLKVPKAPDLVREAAVPKGLHSVRVDGVALVNRLVATGGAPEPSILRDELVEQMRRHDVANPNHVLESSETALVEVRGVIPPGARTGDPMDLLVVAPVQSHVRDLHGGWLMETRLRHQQMLRNGLRKSEPLAVGQGPLLTRADTTPGTDDSLRTKAIVIAGGRVIENRDLGLILRPEFQHVKMAAAIAQAINRRFFFFDGTERRGIAEPLEDDYIKIEVHPRYRRNQYRMMEVARAIGVKPESAETQQRLADLGQKLVDPETSADAALQLEGMGESAIPTLVDALEQDNPELRFYVAEALAYLDRDEALPPLESAIADSPAFRFPGLLAIEGMDGSAAVETLRRLMDQPSLETRYGAFCAIRRRPDGASVLAGQNVSGQFRLFTVPCSCQPAIVVSLRESPEIVMFGPDETIDVTHPLFGPGGLLIKQDPENPGQLRINRFLPGEDDRLAIVPANLTALIHGIADVGGGYGDVVTVLREAKDSGFLQQQLAMDPLPEPMRTYHRDEAEDQDSVADDESSAEVDG